MNKIILIISFCILMARLCFGGNVTPEKAALVAKNFCVERAAYAVNFACTGIESKLAYQKTVKGKAVYYVFNTTDHSFVIVAGDDRVVPVLGYSFESGWVNDPLPVQLTGYLENSELQILFVRDHNLPENEEIRSAWARLTTTGPSGLNPHKGVNSYVAPLLFSTWDQGGPYNNMCPLDTVTGSRAYVGCVATAMAQIMYYYRWPITGVGSKGYTSSNFGYLFADFGNTTYEWNEMTYAAISGYSATAMATLSYHCGISVHMFYGTSGSGANSDSVVFALKNYFRYSQDIQMIERQYYWDTTWIDLLQEQLNAGKLLHYSGSGTGAHAFVCDGYQDDYFHFNWGWSGNYNGYFYVTNLNPGTWNFTENQKAITNIYPEGDYPPNCSGMSNYLSLSGTIDDGSGPEDYTGNNDCFYLIAPQADPSDSISNITLTFNCFNTEPVNDILTIYDGATTNSPVIGTYSGEDMPPAVTSGGNKVLLHFLTNTTEQRSGWFLNYKSNRPQYCQPFEEITSPEGTLEDGSGTKNYNNGCFCRWLIHPPNVQIINLWIDQFDLENENDYVEVYEYDVQSGNINFLGHFTGHNLPPDLSTTLGAMLIDFKTNESVTDLGWKVHFTSMPIGISKNDVARNFSIFPNPASTLIRVNLENYSNLVAGSAGEKTVVTIRNIPGEEMLSKQIQNDETVIDVSGLQNGLYFVGITTGNKQTFCKKLIIIK